MESLRTLFKYALTSLDFKQAIIKNELQFNKHRGPIMLKSYVCDNIRQDKTTEKHTFNVCVYIFIYIDTYI